MKQWKTVLVTAVIASIIFVFAMFVLRGLEASQTERQIKNRIKQYKLVLEEQQLITEIVTVRYEAALIQAKLQPAPPVVPPANE